MMCPVMVFPQSSDKWYCTAAYNIESSEGALGAWNMGDPGLVILCIYLYVAYSLFLALQPSFFLLNSEHVT